MNTPGAFESTWKKVREHLAFRVAAVYGGAIWFVLQLLEVLGVSDDARRRLALGLGVAFPIVVGVAWLVWHWSQREASPRGRHVAARRWLGAAAALLVLGGGLAWIGPRLFGERVTPGADVIAVLPFSATGSVEEYGIGLVDLLTANLDRVGPIRTVNARTVMHQWSETTGGGTPGLEGALEIGRELGAGAILWGSVNRLGNELRISAEMHRTTTGDLIARQQTSAPEDSLLVAVDALTLAILREVWRSSSPIPDLRISAITTNSPAAIRAYMRGERHYRASSWDSAVVAFEEAVRQDTTFALAMLRVSESLGWMTGLGDERAIAYAERAARFTDRLPERERSLVHARLLHEYQDQTSIDSLQNFVARYPDDPMGWFMLGDALFHSQPIRATPAANVMQPFERAIALDPTVTGEYEHPLDMTLVVGDSTSFRQFIGPMREYASEAEIEEKETLAALRWGDPDTALSLLSSHLRSASAGNRSVVFDVLLRPVRSRVVIDPTADPRLLIAALDTAVAAASGTPREMQSRQNLIEVLFMLGRTARGIEEAESLAAAGGTPVIISRLIGAFALPVHRAAADSIVLALERSGRAGQDGLIIPLREYHLSHGNVEASRRIAELTSRSGPPWMAAATRIVDAWERIVAGDTAGGIEAFDEALLSAPYTGPLFFQTGPAVTYYAILQLRDPQTREAGLAWLNYARAFSFPIPIYLGMAAELERFGDIAGAAEAYNHILRLLDGADDSAAPIIAAARNGLERLGREREATRD